MALAWWRVRESSDGGLKALQTSQRSMESRTDSSSSSTVLMPGSPSITFLKSPIVLERRPSERLRLVPESRQESRAIKLVKRCQLVAVIVLSLLAAAVIIFFMTGDRHPPGNSRRRLRD